MVAYAERRRLIQNALAFLPGLSAFFYANKALLPILEQIGQV